MKKFLSIQREGNILILTMNQPETRNALTGNTAVEELVQACERIETAPSIRAVILTATGTSFSSGGNIKDMQRYSTEALCANTIRQEYRHGIQRLPKALYKLEVPVIAAINGPAIGAGLDLACMCDIRIASSTASFAESFVRMGIVPGDGGAWLLPRVVGYSKAAEMAFTGDKLDAMEALECGLISRITEPEQLLTVALSLAGKIAANPAYALRMTKRLLREGEHQSLDSLLELSASFQAIAHQSADHKEAVQAFIEKRQPNFA